MIKQVLRKTGVGVLYLLAYAFLFAVGYFVFLMLFPPSVDETSQNTTQEELIAANPLSLLSAVNEERVKAGVHPLEVHPDLQESAQLKADDMITRNYREHDIPGVDDMYTDKMKQLIYPLCIYSTENLVWNEELLTLDSAIEWWLESDSHREAMLSSDYMYTGIGVSEDKVAVQHFCIAR